MKARTPGGDWLIVGGDFNAEIGANQAQHYPTVMGQFGSGSTSRTGPELLEWCQQEGLVIIDSRFQQPLAKKYTWSHPSNGTGHVLDHFLMPGSQVKYVDSARTVHQGRRGNAGEPLRRPRRVGNGGGEDHWDDYTDHLPIELTWHYWHRWQPRREAPQSVNKPNVQILAKPGREAREAKRKWHETLDAAIIREEGDRRQLAWEKLVEICLQTSMEILGPVPPTRKRPHLVGHTEENRQLDRDVADAMARLRQFRRDDEPRDPQRQQDYAQALRDSREASKRRKLTRRRWKWEWIDGLTDELTTAAGQGDTRRVYAVHRELGLRDERLRTQVAQATVAQPEAEREAWKEHFRQLQEGREWAVDHVWANVKPEAAAPYRWMGEPPTDEEIEACGQRMKNAKAAGADGFVAEFCKLGSPALRRQVHGLVRAAWAEACSALDGEEGAGWPEVWNRGIVVPLWKKKGDRSNKNTWRGICLLSVGSKLLARVVAQRTQLWSDGWLSEEQAGFRKGRGVDDVLQVTRRITEEAATTKPSDDVILIRLFDIEKAYPRVSKDSLWKVLSIKGAPDNFIKVCKALHEATRYQVRIHGGESQEYEADKGLREGCPSSPPLFNAYHQAVLEDFRIRRAQSADQANQHPGLPWIVKADGRVHHGVHSQEHLFRKSKEVVLGDIGFADDTCLIGEAEEMARAEVLLETTMRDWREKVHPGKTEGLRIASTPRAPFDVQQRRDGNSEACGRNAARHSQSGGRYQGKEGPGILENSKNGQGVAFWTSARARSDAA